MADRLNGHTIRSHGMKVTKIHMYDWFIILVLMAIEVVLNVIEPYHRFVGKDMMSDLKYPFKKSTMPIWGVPLIAIVLPYVIFTGIYLKKRDVYDLHHAILGLLYAVLITGVITDAIKDAVGRPRPDFFWRCFPDGKEEYDPARYGDVICHGNKGDVKEGHKSFPSGHSSYTLWEIKLKVVRSNGIMQNTGTFAGLCFLAWYLSVSRVDDYWHHWLDVFAGGFLGFAVASFCYLQFFPPLYDAQGWGPHAYFNMLAKLSRDAAQSEHREGIINMVDSAQVIHELESGTKSS